MRTHLLQLLTALAAISVLLFASVAYAQGEDPTLEDELARLCEESNGRMEDGFCALPVDGAWCGFPDSPPICEDDRFGGRWGVTVEDLTSAGVNADPETGRTQPEQAPTAELPATQPAQAQPGSPQYTG